MAIIHQGAFQQLWKKYGVEFHQQCVHLVTLCSFPNYQEDETMLRETLENLCHSPSAEKHVHIVLAMRGLREPEHSRQSRASHGGDWRPSRGRVYC